MIERLSHYGFLSQQNLPFPIYCMLSYMKVITLSDLWVPLPTLGGTKCCNPKCSSTWKLVSISVVVVQSLSYVRLFVNPWTAAHQAFLCFTISLSLLRLMSIESVIPSNHLIFCHPLLFLPSVFPSIRVFFHESALQIRWPKDWRFSFSISPTNEYSGLISFRIDLLAVQGTLKSLLQHHSSKASVLLCSALFMDQLSHLYMTTGKTIVLPIWISI